MCAKSIQRIDLQLFLVLHHGTAYAICFVSGQLISLLQQIPGTALSESSFLLLEARILLVVIPGAPTSAPSSFLLLGLSRNIRPVAGLAQHECPALFAPVPTVTRTTSHPQTALMSTPLTINDAAMLLRAPGHTTTSKKLLGTKGIPASSILTTSNKKLLWHCFAMGTLYNA